MKVRLIVLGIPVLTLEVEPDVEHVEAEESVIEGGSSHNFERDTNPVTPEDRHKWEWEDRRVGFANPGRPPGVVGVEC